MKWNDVAEDAQAAWLEDPVTQAFLAQLESEAGSACDLAMQYMRNTTGGEAATYGAARAVGAMDAYLKAKQIAETTK